MKLKSISISGMHKVTNKQYDFEDVNYFYGNNGCGKSTILQAIQLAVLGYIPDNKKQNSAIIQHCNGKILNVCAEFDSEDGTIKFDRSYLKKSSKVESSLEITAADDFSAEDVLKDTELPVFNFNEFINMSSNSQKSWFLNLLSNNEEDTVDWKAEFAKTGKATLSDEELMKFIDSFELSTYKGTIEDCNRLNQAIKQRISGLNAMLKDVNGAINSSIMYSDVICDNYDEEIAHHSQSFYADVDRLSELKTKLSTYDSNQNMLASYKSLTAELEQLEVSRKNMLNSEVVITDEDIEESDRLEEKEFALIQELSDLQASKSNLKNIVGNPGTCPYLKSKCESLQSYVDENKANYDRISRKIEEINTQLTDVHNKQAAFLEKWNKRKEYDSQMERINYKYNSVKSSVEQMKNLIDVISIDATADPTILKQDIEIVENSLQYQKQLIAKLTANKEYEKLIKNLEAKKCLYELQLACCKIWDKLTGPNGKPVELAVKPFEEFEKSLSVYLKQAFSDNVCAKFNLSNKANSFSFGLERNGQFVPFEVLSSGEKCMYLICLLSCIVEMSSARWKCILLDDMFDHLDDANFKHVMSIVYQFATDIQFIIASVRRPYDKMTGNCVEVK